MLRDARTVAVVAVLLTACGDTGPTSTVTTQHVPATTHATSPSLTTTAHRSATAAPGTTTMPSAATATSDRAASVLVLTRTAGFRHTSIEPAAAAISTGLSALGISVVVDPDAAMVTSDGLIGFDAIVMLSTTGDWLDATQQAVIEQWASHGGGIAGIHAATDAEPNWPFLEQAIGARFAGHPAVQPGTVVIEDATHPATARLPARWVLSDEFYDLTPNPRDHAHVLATVDESTYTGGTMGSDHPVEWWRDPSSIAGRVWYTALGHPDELWADPTFTAHVVAGVAWTAGVDVRGVAGFSGVATVKEVADRLRTLDLGTGGE